MSLPRGLFCLIESTAEKVKKNAHGGEIEIETTKVPGPKYRDFCCYKRVPTLPDFADKEKKDTPYGIRTRVAGMKTRCPGPD